MGSGLIPLVGTKVGKLFVLQRVNKKARRPHYRCLCDCGNRLTVSHERLIHKKFPKTHCGCATRGIVSHNQKEYHAWHDAIQRCYNTEHHGFSHYGGKGVTVCDRWRDSFENFLSDLGICPETYSLDRIQPDGNYEPSNVRWASSKEQGRNKRNTKYVRKDNGVYVKAADLAEELGISYQRLRQMYVDQGRW